ncbi:hypothetical protein GE09DRAFT_1075522 [Coniochaeta sp. 2T2.1]|nr:hypothetical protein GE09DRAFT_1075522 [Coniochaeta sp. 2T2.1]
MHSIWSLAARAHGCHCQPCARAASILARRSVTPGRLNRRPKVQPSPGFAAPYSTSTDAAAVADTPADRDGWEVVDTGTKVALDPLAALLERTPVYMPRRTRDDPAVLHNANSTPLGIYQALHSICVKPSRLNRELSWNDRRMAHIEKLREELLLPSEEKWWKTSRSRSNLDQEMVAEEERAGKDVHREPETSFQFEKWSDMINKLVDQLLVETYRAPDGTPQQPHLLESAWNNIRMLRSSGYPKYKQINLDHAQAAEARRDLSAVTRNIFRDWRTLKDGFLSRSSDGRTLHPQFEAVFRKRRERFIGKICHNLLVTPYLPCIYNYNTLIAGFASVGEPLFCQAVIDSFLLDSRMRPTPMTAVVCIRHAAKGDIVGFYNIIRRITGDDTRGLLLRRKLISDVKGDRGLFRWARTTDAAVHGDMGFVAERFKVDERLLEATLDRLIDFKQVRHAAKILGACLGEGYNISLRYVHRVVGLCVAQTDRVAALELLRSFLEHVEEIGSIIGESTSGQHRAFAKDLSRLLQICESNADRHSIASLAETMSTRAGAATDVDFAVRISYLRATLWAASVEHWLDDLKPWVNLLGASVASGRLNEDRSKYLAARVSRIQQQHTKADVEASRYQSLLRIASLSELCDVYGQMTVALEQDMSHILSTASREDEYIAPDIADRSSELKLRLRLGDGDILAEHGLAYMRIRPYLDKARALERDIKQILFDELPQEDRDKIEEVRATNSKAFSIAWMVEYWMWHASTVSRRWEKRDRYRWVIPPQLEQGGQESQEQKEQAQPLSKDEFLRGFFGDRDESARKKIPVPSII